MEIGGKEVGASPTVQAPLSTFRICPLLSEVTDGRKALVNAVPLIELANIFHL
jgi:hypothetical protein